MCGIIGVIQSKAKNCLFDGLQRLEYRGYDSSGVAFFDNNKIKCVKRVGKVSKLVNSVKTNFDIGIAHTRWATNGKPTKNNAHPHISYDKAWAVCHNGIIENTDQLKNYTSGITLKSQTDTELIAHCLSKNGKGIFSLIKTAKMLVGSFALVCLNNVYPDTIFVAKKSSPIYINVCPNKSMVASDIVCFDGGTQYYSLQDDEFAVVKSTSVQFYDIYGNEIQKTSELVPESNYNNSKTYFKHNMIKEIYDTPTAIEKIIKHYSASKLVVPWKKYKEIKLIGCGTAYHTCLMGQRYLQDVMNIPINSYIASELVYDKLKVNTNVLCIFVSQSGETADSLAVLKKCKNKKANIMVITNSPLSTMARLGDVVLPMCAGHEFAVASTKAYTCGCLILYLLSCSVIGKLNKALHELKTLQHQITKILNNYSIPNLNKIAKAQKCFFVGKLIDYVTCLEGCLKLKEITYKNCFAYPSGELKHGTLALVDKKSLVFAIETTHSVENKVENNIHEIRARGGSVVKLTTLDHNFCGCRGVNEKLDNLLIMVYIQLLSYHTAVKLYLNPDMPRNLAKSVTVE